MVPLSFPLTCGAGTITTVILLMSEANGILQSFFVILSIVIVILSIVIAIVISYLMMTYSTVLFAFIGSHEQKVISKTDGRFCACYCRTVHYQRHFRSDATDPFIYTGHHGVLILWYLINLFRL